MVRFRARLLSSAAVLVLAALPQAVRAQANPESGKGSPGAGAPVPPAQSESVGPTTQSASPPDGGASVQAAPTPTASQPSAEIVVTGVRASLQSAQAIRRNSTDIVDSIVAQDIGKLPDNTVGDALQRVTGVQITRAAGEAGTVLIRGLPNVTTEINGRDIFTTTGRSVALSDIPAELVAGVDVYKTVSPEQLEGGIAGTINIRLRRPFDFPGLEVAGTARAIYGDQRNAVDPNTSLLLSDRWMTAAGEVGALLSVSYQKRRYLDETAFNFVSIAGPPGADLQIPQTSGAIDNLGNRERTGVDLSLQWRPRSNLEFYVDGTYTGYRNTHASSYLIGIPGAGALQSSTVEPGTPNEVATLTSANNFTLTSEQAYADRTNTFQGAVGGKWTQGPLVVTSDLSFTYSLFRSRDIILDTRFNAPSYSEDFLSNGTPKIGIGGVDVLDGSNFYLNQLFDNISRQVGKELAYRIDGVYSVSLPGVKSLAAGFRYSYRDAKNQQTNGNGIPIAAGVNVNAASVPNLGSLSPGNFLDGDRDIGVSQWFSANSDYLLSHADTLRGIFGQPLGYQPYDPTKAFRSDQNSYAGYVKAYFGFDALALPVSGDFGLRLVGTDEAITGFQILPYTSTVAPSNSAPSYFNVLPSFNGKVQLLHDVYFRVSAGKTVTFPDFTSLNPALGLNSPGPTLLGTGTSGNPDLRPITSVNVDTALEWYFARAGSLTGTYFHRDINGYIQTYGVTETVNNVNYLVSIPESTGAGELQGLEVAYQQFYDFLPGLLRGLGGQANFTYIDSYTQSPASLGGTAVRQPLANVSRYSFNLIGLYELGPFSLRAAYNWRSKYVVAFNAGGLQPQTIISDPVGQLDLSASYAVNPHLVLTLDAANLTREVTQNYFGSALYPRDTDRSDRTIELGARFRY